MSYNYISPRGRDVIITVLNQVSIRQYVFERQCIPILFLLMVVIRTISLFAIYCIREVDFLHIDQSKK